MVSAINPKTLTEAAKPASAADSAKAEKLREAAAQFESIFVNMMMKAMRGTVQSLENKDDGGLFGGTSMGEQIYTDMLDEQYSKIIQGTAGLGLADLIVKQVSALEGLDGDAMSKLSGMQGLKPWQTDSRFVSMPADASMVPKGAPASVSTYNEQVAEAAARYNVDPDLVRAVITRESAGNRYATSHAGAKGLMQLMDSTAADMGVREVFNPRDNIMGGTKYLSQLLTQFNGDEKLALASYNAGPGAVTRYGGIPPYRETRDYVRNVLATRDSFRAQNSGSHQD